MNTPFALFKAKFLVTPCILYRPLLSFSVFVIDLVCGTTNVWLSAGKHCVPGITRQSVQVCTVVVPVVCYGNMHNAVSPCTDRMVSPLTC